MRYIQYSFPPPRTLTVGMCDRERSTHASTLQSTQSKVTNFLTIKVRGPLFCGGDHQLYRVNWVGEQVDFRFNSERSGAAHKGVQNFI